jgi:hypothetical protein
MSTYYLAVDEKNKLLMWPPDHCAIKSPGVYYPSNPFGQMVVMKLILKAP